MVSVKDLKIGTGMPKLCVPITGTNKEEIITQAKNIAASPADIVEWRCDYFTDWKDEAQVVEVLQELRPILEQQVLLFTFRSKEEGSDTFISLDDYVKLNKKVIDTGLIDLVDVECCVSEYVAMELVPYAHGHQVFVIGSSHDFKRTPGVDEMLYRLSYMQQLGVDIGKIAVMPKNKRDVSLVMEMTKKADQELMIPVITMAMGQLGVITRFVGEFFGSCVTFGCLGQESAPGQVDAGLLKQVLTLLHNE